MSEPALFRITDERRRGDAGRLLVVPDPAHALLADHRPGPDPLLGTVVSLEILGFCAERLSGLRAIALDEIVIGPPVLLPAGPVRVLEVAIGRADPSGARRCLLRSRTPTGLGVVHARARVTLGAAPGAAPAVELLPAAPACEIYQVFFHRGALRVVAAARRTSSGLASRFAASPDQHDRAVMRGATWPRLLEFGLQTAGLLALAEDGSMRIPYRIGRIEKLPQAVGALGVPTAHAAFAGAGRRRAITIAIETGRGTVRIDGYRTRPLPFAHDAGRAAPLQAMLRRADA